MTTQTVGAIPEWTLADRLRKARETAGMDQVQLAEAMGIARTTVGNYEHGHTSPRPYILKEWALVTGVPLWWLKGNAAPEGGGPVVAGAGFEPATSGLRARMLAVAA